MEVKNNTRMHEDMFAAKRFLKQKQRAKEKGLEFDLTLIEFIRIVGRKYCFYTGKPMIKPMGEQTESPMTLTLDRIDNSKGYVSGNVVACTRAANALKAVWENPLQELTVEDVQRAAAKTIELINKRKVL